MTQTKTESPPAVSGVVLYVDDDDANLAVFEATCAQEFTIRTASSGKEALHTIEHHEIAVLMVDQRMPEMTGVEILEAARKTSPDTVRLLITAYSDISNAIDAINRGHVRRYLKKPWDPVELKAALHESIDTYRTNRRLQELKRRLLETERVYALGVIAASVAHEIRTPLSVLVGMLDLAAMRADSLSALLSPGQTIGPKEQGATDDIAKFIFEAKAAAHQLVEIAKGIELSNRRADDQRSADLVEVVQLTLKGVKGALLKRANIEIDLKAVPPVRGSQNKLGQVTLNLLVNALQALPEPENQESAPTVTVSMEADGEWVELHVRDTGPGIPEDELERIFRPFFHHQGQRRHRTGAGHLSPHRRGSRRLDFDSKSGGPRHTLHGPLAGSGRSTPVMITCEQ